MQEEQKNTNLPAGKKYTPSDILKFVIPSLIGIILFMLPIKEYDPEINQDKITIPIAFVASFIQNNIGSILPTLILIIVLISALGSLLTKLNIYKPKSDFAKGLFVQTTFWTITRVLAGIFITIQVILYWETF